MYIQYILLTGF